MRRHTFPLLALMTLLMGADGVTVHTSDLPSCAPNTYLIYRGGQIVCEPTLPSCSEQLLHAGPGGNLAALRCIPKYDDALQPAERQRVRDLQAQLQKLQSRLAALHLGPPLQGTFTGYTNATTTGRIEYPGTPAGLPAANARCAAEFGLGAYMCSPREMLGGILSGKLDPNVDRPMAWLYMPTWHNPLPSPAQPLSGLGDNCGGYTNGTTTSGWAGMAVAWSDAALRNARILTFNSGTLASCDQSLPIACCR